MFDFRKYKISIFMIKKNYLFEMIPNRCGFKPPTYK